MWLESCAGMYASCNPSHVRAYQLNLENHMGKANCAGWAVETPPNARARDAVMYSLVGGGGGNRWLLLIGPGHNAQAGVGGLGDRLRHGDGRGAADDEGHFDRTKQVGEIER